MQLSIRLHGGQRPSECVELARAAEAAGFAGIWFAENAFARGILPAAAACAVATSRLRIGTGVFNPFSRHPTMMAMEIGAIDELSNGRAALGVGSGIATATAKLGLQGDKPLGALRDTLVIVRALLAGETVDHAGPAFTARGVKLDYATRGDISIVLAARGDLMLALAGELADGLIVSNMCSAGFTRRAAAIAAASRRAAGRSGPPQIVQYMPCIVRADRATAIAAAKRAVGAMLPGFWSLGQRVASARAGLMTDTGISERDFADAAQRLRAGSDANDVLDERFVRAFSLAGTPDECLVAARIYAEAGATELALTFEGPTRLADMALLGEALARTS